MKVGMTSRRVASQQKSKVEAFIASGVNSHEVLRQNARKVQQGGSLSELLKKDTDWCNPRMRSRTIEANHLAMKKLIGWTGDISLQSINERLIEDFLHRLVNDLGLKSTSVNIHLKQLKAIFQRAVAKHKLIDVHPFKSIVPHRTNRKSDKPKFLTEDHVNLLIVNINDIYFL